MAGRDRNASRQIMLRRITDAARDQLDAEATVTVRGVADRLGVTAPALRHYAYDHDALLDEVRTSIDQDVCDALDAAVAASTEAGPTGRLVDVMRAFRDWALAHPAQFELAFLRDTASQPMRSLDFMKDPRWAPALAIVCLEVGGHIDPRIVASGALFESAISTTTHSTQGLSPCSYQSFSPAS